MLTPDQLLNKLKTLISTPLIQKLHQALGADADLYIVGGSVRDTILEIESYDLDLATRIPADKCTSLLEKSGIRVIPTGIDHGTVTAVINGSNIEITTFRKPGKREETLYSDTIEEDLAGRDFSINAIACSVSDSIIIDPFHGVQDLNDNILKAVGNPTERISEDPHRILRMLRFGPASNRKCDPELISACKALAPELSKISVERVKTELEKILMSETPAEALRLAQQTDILNQFIPEFNKAVGFEQNDFHIHDVFEHSLWVLSRCEHELTLRLAGLFHDLGKTETLSVDDKQRRHFYCHEKESQTIAKEIMRRLRFSNEQIKDTCLLIEYHMRPLDCGPAAVRRLIRDLGPMLPTWLKLKQADSPPTMPLEEFNEKLSDFIALLEQEKEKAKEAPYGKLAVNGNDLMAIGIPAGPGLGKILKEIEEYVIEDPSRNTREILFKKIQETE